MSEREGRGEVMMVRVRADRWLAVCARTGKLLVAGQVGRMISSFIGSNKTFEQQYLEGKVSLQLTPQGSIAERCRAGAFGT